MESEICKDASTGAVAVRRQVFMPRRARDRLPRMARRADRDWRVVSAGLGRRWARSRAMALARRAGA